MLDSRAALPSASQQQPGYHADHQHGRQQQPHRRLDCEQEQMHLLAVTVLTDEDRCQGRHPTSRPERASGSSY